MNETLINGNSYGFANIQMEILNVRPKGISSINYEQQSANADYQGLGYKPVARGFGPNVCTGSIEFQFEEIQAIINATKAAGVSNGDITKLQPFDILVQYGEDSQTITTHKLIKCSFTNITVGASVGQTTLTSTYNLIIGDIDWAA